MSKASECPGSTQLRELLRHDLPSPHQTALCHHLETCVDCVHALEGLAAESHYWRDTARHLAEAEEQTEPALRAAMARLKGAEETPTTVAGGMAVGNTDLSFLTPVDHPELLGLLGRYDVYEVLGRGGMGVVLKARDPSLQRFVALKVLGPHLAANEPNRQRFLREARVAAAIRHENVIAVHAIEEAGTLPYIVMEYVEGPSLQQRLNDAGRLEIPEVVRIARQMAAGLAAAHALGVIHRDIKPANILIEARSDIVKITDFGLARAVDDATLTQKGMVAGTPQFMAPEQARGQKLDARADLFSFGSVLYTLCTGELPFSGDDSMSVLYNVCHATPRPILDLNPDVPIWLVRLIARLQAKKPEDRCATAAEVFDLLMRERAPAELTTVQLEPVPPQRTPINWKPWAVAGVLAMLLALAVTWNWLHPPQPEVIVVEMTDHPGNLLKNPGFEGAIDNTGKEPTYWIPITHFGDEPRARCYRDTDVKLRGAASLSVVKNEVKSPVLEAGFLQSVVKLPAGKTVYLSGALKTRDVAGGVSLKIRLRAGNQVLGEFATPLVQGTTDWKRYGISFAVPEGEIFGDLGLVLQGRGQVWFDDVYLGTEPDERVEQRATPPVNLLQNGSFNQLVNDEPLFWQPVGRVEGNTLKADTDIKQSGAASVTIIKTRPEPDPANWRQDVTQHLPLGKQVVLTGWVKTRAVALAAVGAQLLDSQGQLLAFHTTQGNQSFTGTADWQRFTLRFEVPKEAVRIGILAMVSGTGQAWFDEFELKLDDNPK